MGNRYAEVLATSEMESDKGKEGKLTFFLFFTLANCSIQIARKYIYTVYIIIINIKILLNYSSYYSLLIVLNLRNLMLS